MTPEMLDNLGTLLAKIDPDHDQPEQHNGVHNAHSDTQAEQLPGKTCEQRAGGVAASDLIAEHPLSQDPLLNELVFSMLMWESSIDHATRAAQRIHGELVDLNELRVCTIDELVAILAPRMPRAAERAARMIHVLNAIYDRENALRLEHLREHNKKSVQEYLDSIDGLPIFAGARVVLLVLGWHAFPLDHRLARLLGSRGIITPASPLDQQAAQLERGVRASDALRTYTLIECWAQTQRVSTRTRKSRTSRKSTKGLSS